MNQYEYLKELRSYLSPLGRIEEDRVIEYYAELIVDKIESGIPEKEVLTQLGTPRQLADKILSETQEYEEPQNIKEPKELSVGRIVGFSILIPFVITALAILYSVAVSFVAASVGMQLGGVLTIIGSFFCYVRIFWSRYMPIWSSNICFGFGTFCSLWFVEIYTSLHKNHTKNI